MRYDSPHRRAFTLMELLVVIAIIGVLIAITLVVGNAVSTSTKKSATADIIRVLDNALTAYIADTGDIPPPFVEDPRCVQNPGQFANVLIPVIDGRDMSNTAPNPVTPPGNQIVNSAGLFVLQTAPASTATSVVKARGSSTAKKSVDNLPSKMAKQFDGDSADPDSAQPPLLTPVDAWGRPIRYVHPAFQGIVADADANPNQNHDSARELDKVIGPARTGATYALSMFRRNASTETAPADRNIAGLFPDSDGGRCTGNRPYFYSAGPDGLVGAYMQGGAVSEDYNADNIYTTAPGLPAKYR